MTDALVIGGGPAGLMAADALLSTGRAVTLVEAKPSLGRKFLMAGKSGLNLTRMQSSDPFLESYVGEMHPTLKDCLQGFGPEDVRAWAESLGQETFYGSTGRLFPKVMKASPLLRAWLGRLDAMGLDILTRWRWVGWENNAVHFDTPEGRRVLTPRVTVMAMGGSSWARLGSDGAWAKLFSATGVKTVPFRPSNTGLTIAWSQHMHKHFGSPLKNIALHAGGQTSRGEVVISARGLEGGGLYSMTPMMRDGHALVIDLLPDLAEEEVVKRLSVPRGKQSLSSVLRKRLRLSPAAQSLARESVALLPSDLERLAHLLKHVPITHTGLRPMDEAISTAGGVSFEALDENLMLKDRPGTFCAGEMIDWDAPTGGYLLTACFATGLWAGRNAANYDPPVT